jgi:hypothetical protein
LGLQELVALHVLSSYDFIFAALASAGVPPSGANTTDASSTNSNLAPFSLCLKALTGLPVYTGEVYRGTQIVVAILFI